MIEDYSFYCPNKDTYPPFKCGLYLEEYFIEKVKRTNPDFKKKYIPALWTNFQIEGWFEHKKSTMQESLNTWVVNNPSENGYFTVVQHDDGPCLTLPLNTTVYGACSGNIPIPLIYEDKNNTLVNYPKKSFSQKEILCSFVGNLTSNHAVSPNVRLEVFNKFSNNDNFKMINSGGWTASVNQHLQDVFINTTINSKFAFAPRGYGRSSFRFFECFQLGTIPIYVWNDVNWSPFQDLIDYEKLCIVLHVSEIYSLEEKLLSIDEDKYCAMFKYYEYIKHLFELEGMSNEIIRQNT